MSQLTVAGFSLAVMSGWQPPAAVTATSSEMEASTARAAHTSQECDETTAADACAALSANLGTALAAEGWRECHVLLRQWQCTINLCTAHHSSKGKPAAAQAARHGNAGSLHDHVRPALVLLYQAPGLSKVRLMAPVFACFQQHVCVCVCWGRGFSADSS